MCIDKKYKELSIENLINIVFITRTFKNRRYKAKEFLEAYKEEWLKSFVNYHLAYKNIYGLNSRLNMNVANALYYIGRLYAPEDEAIYYFKASNEWIEKDVQSDNLTLIDSYY